MNLEQIHMHMRMMHDLHRIMQEQQGHPFFQFMPDGAQGFQFTFNFGDATMCPTQPSPPPLPDEHTVVDYDLWFALPQEHQLQTLHRLLHDEALKQALAEGNSKFRRHFLLHYHPDKLNKAEDVQSVCQRTGLTLEQLNNVVKHVIDLLQATS